MLLVRNKNLGGELFVVTSCRWHQMKVITPDGEESKVIYVFSQVGRQQLEQAGESMTTTLATNASRFEFISIEETLAAQRTDDADEELTAQWLRCEEQVMQAAAGLASPFGTDNQQQLTPVAVPFAVHYFANWNEQGGPVIALPVSMFSGQIAPRLLQFMRQFPLEAEGGAVVVEPNISLADAYAVAARFLDEVLRNEETGRTGLVWCDSVTQRERHRRFMRPGAKSVRWDHLQVEAGDRQVLGLQPIEYLSMAIVMVPFLILSFGQPVQGCSYGVLDPILGNMHLTKTPIGI